MRTILLGLSAALLLAGCDRYVSVNVSTDSGGANTASPAANAGPAGPAGPATPAAPGDVPDFRPAGTDAGGANPAAPQGPANPRVQNEIQECVTTANRGTVPPGFDVQRYCSCAVTRIMSSGVPEQQAIQQCAAEQGMSMRPQR